MKPSPRRRTVIAAVCPLLFLFTSCVLGCASVCLAQPAPGHGLASGVAAAFVEAGASPTPGAALAGLTTMGVALRDGPYPLAVDIIAANDAPARRVMYLLPGGGLSFRAAYLAPAARNLARYLCERGYLVIGITPREDGVPADAPDLAQIASWGIAKRRDDIRSVIETVQARVGLPYELLGHSYGAASALDYAAAFPDEPARVVVLDIYTFDPTRDAADVRRAVTTHDAHVTLMRLGVHVDPSYTATRPLIEAALRAPHADSGQPRILLGQRGNFSNEMLLALGFVATPLVPGIHTPLTLLAGDWPVRGGYFTGSLEVARDPRDDAYTFTHVALEALGEVALHLGSGLVPMAFARDYWAAVGRTGSYRLAWERIRAPVLWLNSEHGYGARPHGADAIRAGGNANVTFDVIPGYGHADLLLGARAQDDVWARLVPEGR